MGFSTLKLSGERVLVRGTDREGVEGETVDPARAAIPGVVAPARLPTFRRDGSILPPAQRGNDR